MRMERGFVPAVVQACADGGVDPDVVVTSEVGVALAGCSSCDPDVVRRAGNGAWDVAVERDRALVCVVGAALARAPSLRAKVLAAFADHEPDLVALGASGTSAAAVLAADRLEPALRGLHGRFFEDVAR
jgi:aspartokinase